ncbi:hypothetical protein HN011_012043 [Eciton burchellii]|nr:hypothetical protein HN011_012043 [Eciton burchellii]
MTKLSSIRRTSGARDGWSRTPYFSERAQSPDALFFRLFLAVVRSIMTTFDHHLMIHKSVFTMLVFLEAFVPHAEDRRKTMRKRDEGTEWQLVPDEGMLMLRKAGVHSVASREAAASGGGSVLCPVPSFLLCRGDPHRSQRAQACTRVPVFVPHSCWRGGPYIAECSLFSSGGHATHMFRRRCKSFYKMFRFCRLKDLIKDIA